MGALHITLAAILMTQSPAAVPAGGSGFDGHPITTRNPVAQQYFDKGLELVFAARRNEAIKAFRTAQRIDPTCAMCYWGEALALGPIVNRQMTAEEDSAAQVALKKATLYAQRASSHERAYIRALDRRHGADAVATRQARDSAYARAMGDIVRRFPEDADAAVLHAEAMLLLPEANLPAGSDGAAKEAASSLEAAFEREPAHVGACRLVPLLPVKQRERLEANACERLTNGT